MEVGDLETSSHQNHTLCKYSYNQTLKPQESRRTPALTPFSTDPDFSYSTSLTNVPSTLHNRLRRRRRWKTTTTKTTPHFHCRSVGFAMGMKKRLSSSSTPSLPGEPSASSSAQRSPTNIDTLNSTPREEDDSSKRQPSSASTSRHSFLSRLSLPLPLRNRHSNVADFHIRPHEPHKKYSAGEHVRGSVILVVVKPIRITHLTVCLNGYVRVLKDPTVAAKSQALQSGGSERPQYHGNGFASLFRDEQVLSGDGRLDAGKYEFGFDLLFPSKGLPSSIDVSCSKNALRPPR